MTGTQTKIHGENRMRRLYARLKSNGLDPNYVASVALPGWWNDEIAETDAGYGRALGLISSHLNIAIRPLWDNDAAIQRPNLGKTNFKKHKGVDESDVEWSKCVALGAARIALQAMADPAPAVLPPTGRAIRDAIMAQGQPWVGLPGLLDFLWSSGIPVLHVSNFPKGAKKMAALAARVDARPVVVLSKNHAHASLMLFDLAHEAGHILCKHIDSSDAVLVDSKINGLERSSRPNAQTDPQEQEANRVAVEILTGRPDIQFAHPRSNMAPEDLAAWAKAAAREHGVDPGVVVQNFAHGRQSFSLANAACNLLGDKGDPARLVRSKMLERLRLDQLADEDAEFLLKVAACGVSHALPGGY